MDIIEWMWREVTADIKALDARVSKIERRTERAETAGGVQSYTYASRPLAATGGMSNGGSYIDLAWISNGRKAAEGVGLGTGQLCYYDSTANDWRCVRDDSIVTA